MELHTATRKLMVALPLDEHPWYQQCLQGCVLTWVCAQLSPGCPEPQDWALRAGGDCAVPQALIAPHITVDS